jgi:hypothetical protein
MVDLDGDGDLDVLAANNLTSLAWYRNVSIHRNACFVTRTIGTAVAGAQAVVPADVDGDGDTDAVSTAFLGNAVLWHDNTAGDASAWTTRTIATGFASASVAAAGDVDGTATWTWRRSARRRGPARSPGSRTPRGPAAPGRRVRCRPLSAARRTSSSRTSRETATSTCWARASTARRSSSRTRRGTARPGRR